MAGKLTVKTLSGEIEVLRRHLRELEESLEHRFDDMMEKAVAKILSRGNAPQGPWIRMQGHGSAVDVDARRRLIAECAYLHAERRGFEGGNPAQDWLDAEMEIDQLLLQGEVKGEASTTTGQDALLHQESRA